MENIKIYKATMKDFNDIQKMHNKLVRFEVISLNNYTCNKSWSYLPSGCTFIKTVILHGITYIVKDDKEAIGYICGVIQKDDGINNTSFAEICNIYVDEGYRNRGIATDLIKIFKDVCKKRNIKYIKIKALTNNTDAIKLYSNLNFKSHIIELLLKND